MNQILSKLNEKKLIAAVAAVLVVLALVLVFRPSPLLEEITVEAGVEAVDPAAFLKEGKEGEVAFASGLEKVKLAVPGDYEVELQYKKKTYPAKVLVRDTVKPEAEVRNLGAYQDAELKPMDFVVSIADATEVTAAFKADPDCKTPGSHLVTLVLTDLGGNANEFDAVLTIFADAEPPQLHGVAPMMVYMGSQPDYLAKVTATDDTDLNLTIQVDASGVDVNTPGNYEVHYAVTDAAGHTTTATAVVTVTDDNTAPVILGAKDLTAYLGEEPAYLQGIRVQDNKDPDPILEVESDAVDLTKTGSYPLVYVARDNSGNENRVQVTVTVSSKPNSFVAEGTINALADERLKQIVTDSMTDEAKVRAIYSYVQSHFSFAQRGDKSDWRQSAYTMLKEGSGEGYHYFAVTKLFLERAGIPNIDVHTSAGTAEHYWSLVSIDGGNRYYHVDTTPRVGDDDKFCLVTDAFLDVYSAANGNTHLRDASLYPATPAE